MAGERWRNFQWEVPERFNFTRDVVGRWAAEGEKVALEYRDDAGGKDSRSFREIYLAAGRLAHLLRDRGLRSGDRVLVVLPRIPEWWEVMAGLNLFGAVAAPGTVQLTEKDIAYRAKSAGAKAIITDGANLPKVEGLRREGLLTHCILVGESHEGWISYREAAELPPDFSGPHTRPEDPLLLYFTSGTTGFPKMVLHKQSYPLGHRITGEYWLDLKETDLHWNVSDTGWAKAAWSSYYGPWNAGAAVFVHDARGRFDPARTLQLLAEEPITTLCAPPTVYRQLVQEDLGRYSFRHLRHCAAAGEPLNPEVIDVWRRATGLTIRDGYGQTETVAVVSNPPDLPVRPGSMGKPSPGYQVAVIDHDGHPLPPGKEGDIAIRVRPERPPGIFQEYWNDPEATAAAHRGDYYFTGDRAYVDEDGYFWFVGRADDVIITAGYRVGPFEVESALIEHPAVAEAAVVASPDQIRGEIVKAFVVLAPGYQGSPDLATELQEHVKKVTAPYKYPREIEFVSDLPKTVSGKIRRVELREREREKKAGKAPS